MTTQTTAKPVAHNTSSIFCLMNSRSGTSGCFYFSRMKKLAILLLLAQAGLLIGQEEAPSPEEAITKVFKVLSGQESTIDPEPTKRLTTAAWEALAYLPGEGLDTITTFSLQQAVPDYYNFERDQLILKLIDPKDHNRYGQELKVPYGLSSPTINLYDSKARTVKDKWEIIYLDEFYLALDMGDLRIFFTRTAAQE